MGLIMSWQYRAQLMVPFPQFVHHYVQRNAYQLRTIDYWRPDRRQNGRPSQTSSISKCITRYCTVFKPNYNVIGLQPLRYIDAFDSITYSSTAYD